MLPTSVSASAVASGGGDPKSESVSSSLADDGVRDIFKNEDVERFEDVSLSWWLYRRPPTYLSTIQDGSTPSLFRLCYWNRISGQGYF